MSKQSERIKALEKQVELLNEMITLQNRLFIKETNQMSPTISETNTGENIIEKDFKLKENMRRRIT